MDCPIDLYKWKKEDKLIEFADNADAIANGEPVKILCELQGPVRAFLVEDVEGNKRLIAKSGLVILNDYWR